MTYRMHAALSTAWDIATILFVVSAIPFLVLAYLLAK